MDVEGLQLQLPCGIYSNFACLHALEPGEALCVVASALEYLQLMNVWTVGSRGFVT